MSFFSRRFRHCELITKRRQFSRPLRLEALEERTVLAGEPILVVTAPGNPFSSYYTEILRAEGLNEFATSDIAAVSPATLAERDVVILGEMPLTSLQVTMFSNWVTAGGNLIAMRPDKQLAGLLGLTDAASTRANAYLLVNTASGPGVGIVNETIQYHGAADLYTLNGASSVATLYATATTATPNPAVTLRSVGELGGQAAAFSYDLARSVVYTRQGNPAWSGQNRDGQSPNRSNDLFYGNASFDPQPDWIDLNKIAIPQADEQQRLLANLVLQMNLDNLPLPRFWYLPRGEKAAVVMTGDDHAHGGTAGRFDQYLAASPPGASVDNWDAVRSTSYIYPNTPDLNNAQAAAFVAQGFEIALHVNTNCADWTPAQLDSFYATQLAQFQAAYPSLPASVTNRTHCVTWSDYATQPKVELKYGIRFDTNYYHYGPLGWINGRTGHMTGSAMPMRFADVDGTLIDVYQAHTQLIDETGQDNSSTVNVLLDAALDTRGYYGVFTANMHTDNVPHPGSDAIVASAQARSVPIVSSKQMLTWLDGRNASSFSALSWDSVQKALRFTVTPGAGANGLEGMVPVTSAAGQLSNVIRDGVRITHTTQTIKGVSYAFFPASAGTYEALYGPDTTPPAVTATSPASGASGVPRTTFVTATFSEPVQSETISFVLKDAANNPVAATVSYNPPTKTATLTPSSPLAFSSTYTATVSGAQDVAGNPMAGPVTWSFTTASQPPAVTNATIWPSTAVPANASANDFDAYEVGVKFRSDIDGYVTGVRFYKGAGNTGTHVGHVWTASGTLLDSVTFTTETASGWQQADFAQPVPVQANTIYVASYFVPNGHYAFNNNYFASSGVDSGVLHAPSNAEAGGNGVFRHGTSGFPNSTFNSANYWVDIVFSNTLAPTVTAKTPAPNSTGVSTTAPNITATFNKPVVANTISFVLRDAANNSVAGSVSYNSSTNTATFAPNAALAATTTYTATVSGAEDAGGATMTPVSWSFTTLTPDTTPPTVTATTPAPGATGVSASATVTATFSEPVHDISFELRDAANALVATTLSYNASTNTATLTPSSPLAFSATYTATVLDADDQSHNAMTAPVTWSFTTAATPPAVTNATIWPSTATPAVADSNDPAAYEVGVKFRADIDGYVTGVRFYKGAGNTGTHVGHVWTASGTLLDSVTFTAETATGWQQADFAQPVQIQANTTYVASYFLPNGHYSFNGNYFASAGVDSGVLHALSNAAGGGNGVFREGTSGFPNSTFNSANYWVDIVFSNTLTPGTPVAVNDAYTTAEDNSLTVAASGVLGNDTASGGANLTAVLVASPAHGTLTLNANGGFTYTPAANYNGPDSFTYKANNGALDSNVATVSLTVTAVNDGPVATNDSYGTTVNSALTVAAPGVLGNDIDSDSAALTAVLVSAPAHGTLTLNANGGFTYTPAANYNGPDSFTYKANDGALDSAVATVSLTVTSNLAANNDAYSTAEDSALTVAVPGVLSNDTAAAGTTVTAVLVSGPAHGTLTLNADGSFTYTPAANYNGPDGFSYKANDGQADSNTATVSLTVTPVNDAPVAASNSYSTTKDMPLTVAAPGVLGNDTDVDGNPLTAVLVGGPASGTLTLNADGSFTYTPAANFSGTDGFTYKTNDGSLDSNVATVSLTVTANAAPVANNDSYSTNEDASLMVVAPGVLGSDTDANGDSLIAVLVAGPANGTLTLNANGSFTYAPAANYSGLDSFTYKANDGSLDSNVATVSLTVSAVNDAPVAANDSRTTAEDTPLTVSAPGVLGNDTDVDGPALTAILVAGPANGTLTLNANGSFTYTPNVNYNGPDSFTYKANDGSLDSNVATISLTVTAVNDAPVPANDSRTTAEDAPLTVGAPGVLGNDTDVEGNALTAVLVASPAHGTLTLNANGSFTYTPAANYNGADSFTYRVNDGSLDSNVATVAITVTAVNDAPVAVNDSYTVAEDTPLQVALPGVLGNDTDVDGDALTVVSFVTAPAHGTLVLGSNGAFSYTPVGNYNGPDSFTYQARDPSGALSNVATVSITVTAVNDAPVAANNTLGTLEQVSINLPAPGILGNDTDVEGDSLTAVLVSGPAHGTLTLNANGSFSYAPAAAYNGPDSFTYQARDSNGALSNVATVSITVSPPVLSIDNVTANEGGLLGSTSFTFVVSLSSATSRTINVNFATADGTATAGMALFGGDYNSTSGTLTFTAGQLTKNVVVTVHGDLMTETNETFFVNLSSASTPIADNQGLGTIQNDDSGFLHVAGGEVVGASESDLTSDSLEPIVAEAIAHWAATGVDESALANLRSLDLQIADLPGGAVGAATTDAIWIDVNAAGHGWFMDGEQGHLDLLSVVIHEMGHALGFEHSHEGIMQETLAPGVPAVQGAANDDALLLLSTVSAADGGVAPTGGPAGEQALPSDTQEIVIESTAVSGDELGQSDTSLLVRDTDPLTEDVDQFFATLGEAADDLDIDPVIRRLVS